MKKLLIKSLVVLALIVAIGFGSYIYVFNPVWISSGVRGSLVEVEAVYVYEGLPHQSFEGDLMIKENKRDDVEVRGGYPFYNPRVEAPPEVKKVLVELLSDSGSFRSFTGSKKCGGFHPDYAVSWNSDGIENLMLVCFGCGEVKIFAGEKSYRHDLNSRVKEELRKQLAGFASKRPK